MYHALHRHLTPRHPLYALIRFLSCDTETTTFSFVFADTFSRIAMHLLNCTRLSCKGYPRSSAARGKILHPRSTIVARPGALSRPVIANLERISPHSLRSCRSESGSSACIGPRSAAGPSINVTKYSYIMSPNTLPPGNGRPLRHDSGHRILRNLSRWQSAARYLRPA